ncbi:MAG: polyketide synthase dehydratase domain-containing protein, partial [Anaerolineales bacterium]|nr:polyketide synthase dehydratase domain-containing protein [Anaerolineales bacterium]
LAPRLIELCFQTAGIWQMETDKVLALPAALGSVTTYEQPAEGTALYAQVTANREGDALSFDAQVVDEAGKVYVVLTGYRTIALPGEVVLSDE